MHKNPSDNESDKDYERSLYFVIDNLGCMSDQKQIRSLSTLLSEQTVTDNISKLGFIEVESGISSSEGKFWRKRLFCRQAEMVTVSEEIGDYWPKDPVISIYGSDNTIKEIMREHSQ